MLRTKTLLNDHPKRGELWIVDLNSPGRDYATEIVKTRPAVILNFRYDRFGCAVVIVVPLSSRIDLEDDATFLIRPTQQNGLRSTGIAVTDHLRSVDPRRCRYRIGRLDDSTFLKLREAAVLLLTTA